MKQVTIVMWYEYLQKNFLFDDKYSSNKDNVFSKYIELKSEFEKNGFNVNCSNNKLDLSLIHI